MKTSGTRANPVTGLAGVTLAAALLIGPAAAPAQSLQPVDLELVLAVDVSQSMDYEEHRLQRQGYAEAFRHQDVIDALIFGSRGGVVVTYIEWGDAYAQTEIVPWTLIQTAEDAAAFADALEQTPVFPERRTSISRALLHAADLIESNGYDGARKVIDISGDGPNNSGGAVTEARDNVVGRGIVINGLPIILENNGGLDWYDIPNLDEYYEDCVIGGSGSFIAVVRSIDELAATIRGKMVLEIAGIMPRMENGRIVPVQFSLDNQAERGANCLIGEQMLGRGGRFR